MCTWWSAKRKKKKERKDWSLRGILGYTLKFIMRRCVPLWYWGANIAYKKETSTRTRLKLMMRLALLDMNMHAVFLLFWGMCITVAMMIEFVVFNYLKNARCLPLRVFTLKWFVSSSNRTYWSDANVDNIFTRFNFTIILDLIRTKFL